MAKSGQEKKVTKKPADQASASKTEKASSTSKQQAEDDPGLDDEDLEVPDEWEKVDEDETWDPDFDEFDVPKSKTAKTGGKKATEEDDFSSDDEFKDQGFFDDDAGGFDDDDNY